MLAWLKKILKGRKRLLDMEKNDNIVECESAEVVQSTTLPKKRKHKLEIRLLEADYEDVPDGAPPRWRPVNMGRDSGKPIIVEVADKKELVDLQQRYAMCDQKMEIIREIDPFDDAPTPKPASISQNNQAIPVGYSSSQPGISQLSLATNAQIQTQQVVQPPAVVQPAAQKLKPKIVTIGDMQVKYDGDKVYQKQWVKLNATEAANFRIVNDSSNKIVPLSGKHIECKRWVIVEEDANEDDDMSNIVAGE